MVVFDSSIKVESVKDFYTDVKGEVENLPEGSTDKVDIYFTTTGGLQYLVPYLYGVINKYESKIRLILTMEMSSSGFDLLYLLRKKEIYAGPEFTFSMTHMGAQNCDIRDQKILSILTEHKDKEVQLWKKRYKSIGFTQEELKQYVSGDDIYFDRKRTFELFPNIKEFNPYGR